MKKLVRTIGLVAFWISWPVLWVYLRRGIRTRVLIEHNGKVLVVKALMGIGEWQLPGGGLHRGEDPQHGAIREVREETGLVLSPEQLTPLNDNQVSSHMTIHGLTFRYLGFFAALNYEPSLSPQRTEITDIGWIEPAKLTVKTASKDVLAILEQWSAKR